VGSSSISSGSWKSQRTSAGRHFAELSLAFAWLWWAPELSWAALQQELSSGRPQLTVSFCMF
jgi:hypothetical protein